LNISGNQRAKKRINVVHISQPLREREKEVSSKKYSEQYITGPR